MLKVGPTKESLQLLSDIILVIAKVHLLLEI